MVQSLSLMFIEWANDPAFAALFGVKEENDNAHPGLLIFFARFLVGPSAAAAAAAVAAAVAAAACALAAALAAPALLLFLGVFASGVFIALVDP